MAETMARPRIRLRGFRLPDPPGPGVDDVGTADVVLLPAAGDGFAIPVPIHFRAGEYREGPAGFKTWGWDGNREAPTLSPSFLCRLQIPGGTAALWPEWEPHRGEHLTIHLFVRGGRLELVSDSTVAAG